VTQRHQRHGETERVREGFEARLEDGFEWLEDNSRLVVILVIGAIAVGAASAGAYEWVERRALGAQDALSRVERTYFESMGSEPGAFYVTEPANLERGRESREAALVGYELVMVDHAGSVAAEIAWLRAAEVEVDLGQLEAAETRLAQAPEVLSSGGALLATALRLRGFVLDELQRPAEAAAAYELGAAVESYPATEELWLAAGESSIRAGDDAGAIRAFEQVLIADPAYAERVGVVDRLEALRLAASPATPEPVSAQ
jgi:tetratricopeptide (TPR) repeat protein